MNPSLASTSEEHPIVVVRFPSRRAYFTCLKQLSDRTLLVAEELRSLEPGMRAELKISFGDSNRNFRLLGRIEKATETRSRAKNMLVMETRDERFACDQISAFCSGRMESSRRFRTSIGCTICWGPKKIVAKVQDVSLTGAFLMLRSPTAFPSGVHLSIEVKEGWWGWQTRKIPARVAWAGEKEGTPGMGIQFSGDPKLALGLMRKHRVA